MTRKTTVLYEAVLRKINTMESQFQQTQVIADFEEAPATALRNVYGDQLIVSGAGAMRPSAILRIMYSSPGKYRKSVSYLSCGHHHGSLPLLTFDIRLFDI